MSVALPKLIVQPDDGIGPVLEFIRAARRSLLIKQFTFSESSLIEAVIDRKNQGVVDLLRNVCIDQNLSVAAEPGPQCVRVFVIHDGFNGGGLQERHG